MKTLILLKKWEGGVGRVVVEVKEELERRGHYVKTISREEDMKIYSLKNSIFPLRKRVKQLMKKENYYIIYTQDWSMALPLIMPYKIHKKKHYCCFHGIEPKKNRIFQKIVGKKMKQYLIAVSSKNHKTFKKSHYVPNGVNINTFKPLEKERKYLGWINKDSETISKEQIKKLGGSLYVTTVVHEETAEGAAIKNVIENHVRPDYVIIGEPSNLDICIGHRGRAVIEVNTEGRSSHASMPELGKNAAYELIDVINKLKELELDQDDFLGKETMALVHISCEPGSGPVVPDKAKAVLDFRIIQETTEKTLLNKIDKVMNELNVEGEAEIVTEELESYNGEKIEAKYFFPAWKTKNDEFISSVKKALKFVDDTEIRSWTFSTDGVYTAGKAKIPTIGFGPGNEELAHQPNEHTETNEIEIAVQGYKSILKELMR